MASAIFIVPFVEGVGAQLSMGQIAPNGPQEGDGWSLIGQVPQAPTCMVRIWASEAVLDELAENPDYLFVEDVP
jgi:hypothetical protein